MMDYLIREATDNDAESLADCWIDSFAQQFSNGELAEIGLDRPDTIKFMRELISNQDEVFKFWLAATDDGTILGYSTTQPTYLTPHRPFREGIGLIMTFLSSSYQSSGIGTKLVDHNLAHCKATGKIKVIMGYQMYSNERSVKITDRLGFVRVGKLPETDLFPDYGIIMLPL
jgi:L-amino acid N-acyltransferase YncA